METCLEKLSIPVCVSTRLKVQKFLKSVILNTDLLQFTNSSAFTPTLSYNNFEIHVGGGGTRSQIYLALDSNCVKNFNSLA